jgi:Ni/Co efflux regulator RcnB
MKVLSKLLAASALLAAPVALAAHEPVNKDQKPATAELKNEAAKVEPQKHSGGTDSKGCHTNSKTGDYHCHNPK